MRTNLRCELQLPISLGVHTRGGSESFGDSWQMTRLSNSLLSRVALLLVIIERDLKLSGEGETKSCGEEGVKYPRVESANTLFRTELRGKGPGHLSLAVRLLTDLHVQKLVPSLCCPMPLILQTCFTAGIPF